MIVGGQTSARAFTIIDYHQLSLTIMRRLTRALSLLRKRKSPGMVSSLPPHKKKAQHFLKEGYRKTSTMTPHLVIVFCSLLPIPLKHRDCSLFLKLNSSFAWEIDWFNCLGLSIQRSFAFALVLLYNYITSVILLILSFSDSSSVVIFVSSCEKTKNYDVKSLIISDRIIL